MGEIVQICKDGGLVYSLVNRRNIVQIMNDLIHKVEALGVCDLDKEINQTASILLYFISSYNYVKFVEKDFGKLVLSIKHRLIDKFDKNETT